LALLRSTNAKICENKFSLWAVVSGMEVISGRASSYVHWESSAASGEEDYPNPRECLLPHFFQVIDYTLP
jgi:hypothetical protein